MNTLHPQDLLWCTRRLNPLVRAMLKKYGPRVFVAGGYVRSCVGNEPVNDVDVFVSSKEDALLFASYLAAGEHKIHETENAYTLRGFGPAIQFIHRWTFTEPGACIASFDFTIARGAFWWEPMPTTEDQNTGAWRSIVDPDFYADLAGKRIVYAAPVRNEDAGGSMLRVLKFYQRGYRIPLDSLGAVIARLMQGVRSEAFEDRKDRTVEEQLAKVLTGLLREVDPNIDPDHIAHLPTIEEATTTSTETHE